MTEHLIESILLLFVRVSAFVAFLPLFGGKSIPRTVKIGLAVGLTLVWSLQYAPASALQLSASGRNSGLLIGWLACREATLGAALGWLLGMILIPVRIAGSYIAQEMGLTIATLTSSNGEASSNVLSEILDGLAVLLFLSLNGHHIFFQGMNACFQVFPIGMAWQLPEQSTVTTIIASVSTAGIELAAPVAMLLLGTTVSLLFVMRQTPQFNLFNFGMPVRLLAGLAGLFLFIPDLILQTTILVERWFVQFS